MAESHQSSNPNAFHFHHQPQQQLQQQQHHHHHHLLPQQLYYQQPQQWYTAYPQNNYMSLPPQVVMDAQKRTPPPPPPPPGDQSHAYLQQPQQPLPYYLQGGDYYYCQYSTPPQPQFTYTYGPQDQVWQGDNNWGYQQQPLSYPGQISGMSQEDLWAAKARAWAASKAPPNDSVSALQGPVTGQGYQDLTQPKSDLKGQQYLSQLPGQDEIGTAYYQSMANKGPQSLVAEQLFRTSDNAQSGTLPMEAPEQKATGKASDRHIHVDDKILGLVNASENQAPCALSATSVFSSYPPQSQGTSHDSHPSFPSFAYSEQPSALGYEHHQPAFPSQQPEQVQQPSQVTQSMPQLSQPVLPPLPQPQPQPQPHTHLQPKLDVQQSTQLETQLSRQPQFQSSAMMEVEAEFGLSPASLQSWAPIGGPGMPFPPPGIGAVTTQFDALNPSHPLPPLRLFGSTQEGLRFPSAPPYVSGGSPVVLPGSGVKGWTPLVMDNSVDRPKKAAVPSWLREELLKKRAAGNTGMVALGESTHVNGGEPSSPSNPNSGKVQRSSPGLSDDEDDEEVLQWPGFPSLWKVMETQSSLMAYTFPLHDLITLVALRSESPNWDEPR